MKIVGKFIGPARYGFATNKVYELNMSTDVNNQYIWVKDVNSPAYNFYINLMNLAKDWEIPTHESKEC